MRTVAVVLVLVLGGCAGDATGAGGGGGGGEEHDASEWACSCMALADSEPGETAAAAGGAWSDWEPATAICAQFSVTAVPLSKASCEDETDEFCKCTCSKLDAECRTNVKENCEPGETFFDSFGDAERCPD